MYLVYIYYVNINVYKIFKIRKKYITFSHVKLITTLKSISHGVKPYFYHIELEVCGISKAVNGGLGMD